MKESQHGSGTSPSGGRGTSRTKFGVDPHRGFLGVSSRQLIIPRDRTDKFGNVTIKIDREHAQSNLPKTKNLLQSFIQ